MLGWRQVQTFQDDRLDRVTEEGQIDGIALRLQSTLRSGDRVLLIHIGGVADPLGKAHLLSRAGAEDRGLAQDFRPRPGQPLGDRGFATGRPRLYCLIEQRADNPDGGGEDTDAGNQDG